MANCVIATYLVVSLQSHPHVRAEVQPAAVGRHVRGQGDLVGDLGEDARHGGHSQVAASRPCVGLQQVGAVVGEGIFPNGVRLAFAIVLFVRLSPDPYLILPDALHETLDGPPPRRPLVGCVTYHDGAALLEVLPLEDVGVKIACGDTRNFGVMSAHLRHGSHVKGQVKENDTDNVTA